jgi:magnesium transporter
VREIGTGLVLGTFLGALGFVRVVVWQQLGWFDFGDHAVRLGLVVWISLIGIVCVGTIAGSMLPFALRAFRLDPATSSAPFVATLVDVAGLIIYFAVAKLLLSGTLL